MSAIGCQSLSCPLALPPASLAHVLVMAFVIPTASVVSIIVFSGGRFLLYLLLYLLSLAFSVILASIVCVGRLRNGMLFLPHLLSLAAALSPSRSFELELFRIVILRQIYPGAA